MTINGASAILALTLSIALAAQPLAAETPIWRAGSDRPAPGETPPSPRVLAAVVRHLDPYDVEMLDRCVAEQSLRPHDYARFLRQVRIPAGAGIELYFVRPALDSDCLALYGAHLFRYFLVERRAKTGRWRIAFADGGDAFAVFARTHHGLNDIEPTGCDAGHCGSDRMIFDGVRYRSSQCHVTTWETGRQITRPMRCWSGSATSTRRRSSIQR